MFQHFSPRFPRLVFAELTTALFFLTIGTALAAIHYVDQNSTNAVPPYTNWPTAATNIQDAVEAAVAGDDIVVTNGTYATGGRINGIGYGARVEVDKPLSLRSVNGPQFTTIAGGSPSGVRCVSLTNSATLSGFTLTHGLNLSLAGGGGGVLCAASSAVVSNCVITGNAAGSVDLSPPGSGGGAYGGTLNDCSLSGNSATSAGGGAYGCTLNNCTLNNNVAGTLKSPGTGGGAFGCALTRCTLIGNSAASGGGADNSTLTNCAVTGNSACCNNGAGAAAHSCILNNCTLAGNHNDNGPGGGATFSALNNCISFGNTNGTIGSVGCEDCDSPGRLVGNNWIGDPLFVDLLMRNLRLQSNSPCINAGNNAYAPTGPDLDGNARIAGGTVDIGAYEFQLPVSQVSYAWLQQFGLPIDRSSDTADPDGDAVDNYHEWLADTDPTNALSSPAQLTITPSGVPPGGIVLTWSTNAVGFNLQSTANLLSPVWTTNLPAPVVVSGQNTVTNSFDGAQQFYRLIR